MTTLLTALKETNVVLGEVATDCENLHHLFLGDRLRQQVKLNRAVIASIEKCCHDHPGQDNNSLTITNLVPPEIGRGEAGEGTKTGEWEAGDHDDHDGEGPRRGDTRVRRIGSDGLRVVLVDGPLLVKRLSASGFRPPVMAMKAF